MRGPGFTLSSLRKANVTLQCVQYDKRPCHPVEFDKSYDKIPCHYNNSNTCTPSGNLRYYTMHYLPLSSVLMSLLPSLYRGAGRL